MEKPKLPNMALQVVLSIVLVTIATFSVFNEGGERVEGKQHMLDELRREHSNSDYSVAPGMKMVEIGFANEI